MKKNRMMRLASGLLVAVLATTSMISGTYAKYVTTTSATDTARVAKWGVTVAATKNLFDETYVKDDEEAVFEGDFSVDENDDVNVVAPGTKGSMYFSIDGMPEVAVDVEVNFEAVEDALSMITLPEGTYVDYTEATYATEDNTETDYDDTTVAAYNETFTLDENYYPILWTLKKSDENVASIEAWKDVDAVENMEEVNLDTVRDYFNNLSAQYKPNTNLNEVFGYYELSWEWPFESGHDEADTYLGNVIADAPADINKTDVVTTEAFNLKITVTQID